MRLTAGRVDEICRSVLQGQSFPCHLTTEHDDDGEARYTGKELECAGALLFHYKRKHFNGQMARIAERISGWDIGEVEGAETVFNSTAEMRATAWQRGRKRAACAERSAK